jgi:hypothetical protein
MSVCAYLISESALCVSRRPCLTATPAGGIAAHRATKDDPANDNDEPWEIAFIAITRPGQARP